MGLETAAIIALATAAGSAGAGVAGAKISSGAAKSAAQKQTEAANHAADVQGQSQREALAFQQQQAAEDKARYEQAQQQNYNQYLARYKAAQGLGHSIGFDLPDAQPYQPAPGAQMQPTGAQATGGGIPKTTGDVNKDLQLANQLTGSNHVDPQYWIKAGYAKDPQYFFQKMLGMDAGPQDAPKQGPYAGNTGAKAPAASGAQFARPIAAYMNPSLGGGMPTPQGDFQLRSINAYR